MLLAKSHVLVLLCAVKLCFASGETLGTSRSFLTHQAEAALRASAPTAPSPSNLLPDLELSIDSIVPVLFPFGSFGGEWELTISISNLGSATAEGAYVAGDEIGLYYFVGNVAPGTKVTARRAIFWMPPFTSLVHLHSVSNESNKANNSVFVSSPLGLGPEPIRFWVPMEVFRDGERTSLLFFPDSSVLNIGDSVLRFNPVTGLTQTRQPLGGKAFGVFNSADGSGLFVDTDNGFLDLDPNTLAILRRIALPANCRVTDIAQDPANPERIAVALLNNFSPGLGSVVILADGREVARTSESARPDVVIWTAANNLRTFATGVKTEVTDYTVGEFTIVVANNLSENRLQIFGTIKKAGGLLFGPNGEIYDLLRKRLGGRLPAPRTREGWHGAPGVIEPDIRAGRTYSAASTDGSNWIYVHDLNRQLIYERHPIRVPLPTKLTRWGLDGFAFTSDSRQVFILRADITPSSLSTDLSIRLAAQDYQFNQEGLAKLRFVVANQGAKSATNLVLSFESSSQSNVLPDPVPNGFLSTNLGKLDLRIADLPAGQEIAVDANVSISGADVAMDSIYATIKSARADTDLSNNRAAAYIVNGRPLRRRETAVFPISANSMATDGTNLFVTVRDSDQFAGNSLVRMNLRTAEVSPPLWVGSNPAQVELSPDGQTAYIGLDGESAIQAVDLKSWSLQTNFVLPAGTVATQIGVFQTNDLIIATSDQVIGRYRNGVRLPSVLKSVTSFAINRETNDVYVKDNTFSDVPLFRSTASAIGLQIVQSFSPRIPVRSAFSFFDQHVYFDHGQIISISENREIPVPGAYFFRCALFPHHDVIVYATAEGIGSRFATMFYGVSLTNRLPVGVSEVYLPPGVYGPLLAVLGSGVAINNDQLVLVTFPHFLRHMLEADLQLRATGPGVLYAGSKGAFTLIVTNIGPDVARSVELSASFSGYEILTTSNAPAKPSMPGEPFLTYSLNDIPPGESAILRVQVQATNGLLGGSFRVGSETHDTNRANNALISFGSPSPVGATFSASEIKLKLRDIITKEDGVTMLGSTANDVFGAAIVRVDPVGGWISAVTQLPASTGRLVERDEEVAVLLPRVSGIFFLENDRSEGALTILEKDGKFINPTDLALHPTNTSVLAVSADDDELYGFVTLLTNRSILPNQVSYQTEIDRIEFSPSGHQLYTLETRSSGHGFEIYDVTSKGLSHLAGRNPFEGFTNDLKTVGNLVLASSGQIYNPGEDRIITNLFVWPTNSTAIAVDLAASRLYFIAGNQNKSYLGVYSSTNFACFSTNELPSMMPAENAVRFGPNGLAFHSEDRLFLIQSPAIFAPTGFDWDGDGMPDDWESVFGFNPLRFEDGSMDFDLDGASNGDEFRSGTDPTLSESVFTTSISRTSDGTFLIRFSSIPGRSYQLQRSGALPFLQWIPASPVELATNVQTSISMQPSSEREFYRILTLP
jgi:hypothetical protein